MTEQATVFVSFARINRNAAAQVVNGLHTTGFQV